MKKLNVLNKKNNVEGIATELENGRFAIEAAGETKEVAASTFKRWFKVLSEVVEVVETEEAQLEALLEDAVIVEEVAAPKAPKAEKAAAQKVETRGGKTEKIVTTLAFNNVNVQITEYNGYVCDVLLINSTTGEVEYKSPTMSIKGALEHLGFEGEALKAARKQISQAKKAAILAAR